MEQYNDNFVITAKNTDHAEEGLVINDEDKCRGFALALFEENTIASKIMHVSIADLAGWIAGDEQMLKAARLAVLFSAVEGRKPSDAEAGSIEKLFGLEVKP